MFDAACLPEEVLIHLDGPPRPARYAVGQAVLGVDTQGEPCEAVVLGSQMRWLGAHCPAARFYSLERLSGRRGRCYASERLLSVIQVDPDPLDYLPLSSLPLPAELLPLVFAALATCDLPAVSRVCVGWRNAAAPFLSRVQRSEVACVLSDVIDDVVADTWDDMPMEFYGDGVPGECLCCDVPGFAFSSCQSCGAPVEPADHSYHYLYGEWVVGPRPE